MIGKKRIEATLKAIEDDIRSHKSKVDKARAQKEQAQGRLNTLMERLKKDFGISSFKDALNELENLKAEIEELTENCASRRDELMGKMNELDKRTGTVG